MYDNLKTERYSETTVRWIKFDKNRINIEYVYEKNRKVSELVKKHNATYGFNLPFVYRGNVLGNSEVEDELISSAYGKMLNWHSFSATNGELEIGKTDIKDEQDFLVQSSPLIVENGKLCHEKYIKEEDVNSDIAYSRCQRTAVGLDDSGDLIVAICDGRTSHSRGLTLGELGQFLINKGATIALNGDGGGSTTLADKNGSIGQNNGHNERTVHHALLVYVEPMPKMDGTASVYVNGDKVSTGYISRGVTYVPLRDVSTSLGAKISWHGKTRTINIKD